MWEPKNVNGHIEVFKDGVFQFSCDNMAEAHREMEEFDESP